MPSAWRKQSHRTGISSRFFFGLFILSQCPQHTRSFVSVSRQSSALGYGFALDMRGLPKILTAGIDYEADYQRVTQNGQADTDCYVGIGDDVNFDRVVFDSPNVCLDIAVMNLPNQPPVAGLPDAVVTAMAGQQPLIVSLEYGEDDITQAALVDSALLPFRYFPAVMTTDVQVGAVYVALHPTHGANIAPVPTNTANAASNNQAEELKSTWFFLEEMTRPAPIFVEPNATDVDHSPKIAKYNMLTKDMEWIHTLETQDGKSLITGMALSHLRNKLVIVGSATGSGPGLGANAVSAGDWDGFMTVLDMDDGDLKTGDWNLTWNAQHSIRIRTQKNIDDVVLNVCVQKDKAFVVGITNGRFEGNVDGGAFIMMYDIDNFSLKWVKQIPGKGLEATHCVVEGDTLYVGGRVPPDIEVGDRNGQSAAKATHDIFVAYFKTLTGEMTNLRQIDSHRDDELMGMIVHALSSSESKLIIAANAKDFSTGKNIIYTMDLDSQGRHDWENLPPGMDPLTGKITETQTNPPLSNAPVDGDQSPGHNADDWVIATAVTVPAILLLVVTFYYFCCLSSAQVPLDYPDVPTHGDAVQDTELTPATSPTGEERPVV